MLCVRAVCARCVRAPCARTGVCARCAVRALPVREPQCVSTSWPHKAAAPACLVVDTRAPMRPDILHARVGQRLEFRQHARGVDREGALRDEHADLQWEKAREGERRREEVREDQ